MAETITVDATELMRSVSLNVKPIKMRSFVLRLWISCRLLMLAALIGGFKLEFEEEELENG